MFSSRLPPQKNNREKPGYRGAKQFWRPHGHGQMVYQDGTVRCLSLLAPLGLFEAKASSCLVVVHAFLRTLPLLRRCMKASGAKVSTMVKGPCTLVMGIDIQDNGNLARRMDLGL